jgi:hypothetical protein
LYDEVTHRFAMECGNSSRTFGCEEELPHFFRAQGKDKAGE